MEKNDDGHFWGMVLAAAAVAITGAVALLRSFRTSRDGGRTWEGNTKGKDEPVPPRGTDKLDPPE